MEIREFRAENRDVNDIFETQGLHPADVECILKAMYRPIKDGGMIVGQPGTGKTTFIYALQKISPNTVYSLNKDEFYSCIIKGEFPDVSSVYQRIGGNCGNEIFVDDVHYVCRALQLIRPTNENVAKSKENEIVNFFEEIANQGKPVIWVADSGPSDLITGFIDLKNREKILKIINYLVTPFDAETMKKYLGSEAKGYADIGKNVLNLNYRKIPTISEIYSDFVGEELSTITSKYLTREEYIASIKKQKITDFLAKHGVDLVSLLYGENGENEQPNLDKKPIIVSIYTIKPWESKKEKYGGLEAELNRNLYRNICKKFNIKDIPFFVPELPKLKINGRNLIIPEVKIESEYLYDQNFVEEINKKWSGLRKHDQFAAALQTLTDDEYRYYLFFNFDNRDEICKLAKRAKINFNSWYLSPETTRVFYLFDDNGVCDVWPNTIKRHWLVTVRDLEVLCKEYGEISKSKLRIKLGVEDDSRCCWPEQFYTLSKENCKVGIYTLDDLAKLRTRLKEKVEKAVFGEPLSKKLVKANTDEAVQTELLKYELGQQ